MSVENFIEMPLNQIEDIVLNSKDPDALYRIQIALGKKRTNLHVSMLKFQDDETTIRRKGEIMLIEDLRDICRRRQEEVKEENNVFNRRFRGIAQKVLPSDTYNRIAEEARRDR